MAVYGAVNPATGNRWRGVYTPDILAVDEGPTTFTDWFAQQMRWSWGHVADHQPPLSPDAAQNVPPAAGQLHAAPAVLPAGRPQWLLSITPTTAYMVGGVHLGIPIRLWALCWLSSISSIMAFWVWSHRFNLTSRRLGLTGLGLVLMTIPVYAAAGLRWLSRRGLPYVVTAKGEAASPDSLRTFRPHLTWLCWVLVLLALGAAGVLHAFPLIIFWASVAAAICATRSRST